MASTPITTALTWQSGNRRPAELLRIGAFALVVLALEAILAHGVVGPQISRYVFLFVGLFAVALVLRFPMATSLVFFALTDFIFHPLFLSHQVGPLNVRPYEVALVLLLILAAARPKRRTWGGVPGLALAIFFICLLISAALAIQGGATSLHEALDWGRPFGLLGFFYVVVRLFPAPPDRQLLLTGAAVIAAVTGVIALLIALGAGFGSSLQESAGNTVKELGGSGGASRVRLPGLSAGYALFWYVVVQVAVKRGTPRFWWGLLLVGIALDIVVSYNRNMWIGVIFGMILMAIFGGGLLRMRLAVSILVAVAGIALMLTVGGSSTDRVLKPVVERGETLVNPSKTAQESSLESRALETSVAWRAVESNPVFGVGAGASFGVYLTEAVRSGGSVIGFTRIPQLFLHNQYLYLVLVAGLPGLIAFLVFLGTPVAYSVRRWRRDTAMLACGVGIAMIMLSSFVAIYFSVIDMTAVLGLLTGVIVASAEDPPEEASARTRAG
jgi:O-antigen ligase